MNDEEFAKRLRMLQEGKGLTLKEFSKGISYSYHTVYSWVEGNHRPGIDALVIIADYFNVSLDYLVGRTEKRG